MLIQDSGLISLVKLAKIGCVANHREIWNPQNKNEFQRKKDFTFIKLKPDWISTYSTKMTTETYF